MNNYYKKNQTLDDLVKKEEKKRRHNQPKHVKENSFYAKPTNSGIMKPSKPKFGSIQEIKDAQKEQKKLITAMHKQEWADLSIGTDEIKITNKQNRKKAEQGLKDLDLELTAAYGLGKNGYWSKQSKTYGLEKKEQNKQLDNVVHSYGQQSMPKRPSVKPNIPADPITRSVPQKPMIMDKTNYGIKPKQEIAKGAQRQKEQQIAQKQDEIVHGQNLGQISKWKLDDELQKLKVEKEVILWKQNQPQAPTGDMYDAKKRDYNDQIAKAAGDYLNEYGGKDSEETKTAWAEYQNNISDLVARRDAFNRAKMDADTSAPVDNADGTWKQRAEEKPTTEYTDYIVPADTKPEDGENGAGYNPFGENYYFDEDGNRVLGEQSDAGTVDTFVMISRTDTTNGEEINSLVLGDKEYLVLNNFDTLDQMEVIDSYTITKEEFDTAGFLLGIPEYLSDSPGPLMIIETIANFVEGANNSLSRDSLRVDIINEDGEEKAVIAFETKDNQFVSFYNNPRRTKVDDEGTHVYVSNSWGSCLRYYIDKRHTTDDTLGYMYVDNGKLMFKRNILPNDKFLMSEKPGLPYKDMTYLYSQPFEIGQHE